MTSSKDEFAVCEGRSKVAARRRTQHPPAKPEHWNSTQCTRACQTDKKVPKRIKQSAFDEFFAARVQCKVDLLYVDQQQNKLHHAENHNRPIQSAVT